MDIKKWRVEQRRHLLAQRSQLPKAQRFALSQSITRLIADAFPLPQWEVTGFYWPFQGEFDPRFVVKHLRDANKVVALPEVVEKNAPLQFRQWWLGVEVKKGVYDLPVPVGTPIVVPTVLLMPPIGFDEQGFRLGYGGGYFDRTLAALAVVPIKIGVAFELSRIPTIYPQPHDVAMDFVVTENGIHMRNEDGQLELTADRERIQTHFYALQAQYAKDAHG